MSSPDATDFVAQLMASRADVKHWRGKVEAAMRDGTDETTLAYYKQQLEHEIKVTESLLALSVAAASVSKKDDGTCTPQERPAPIETENHLRFLWTTGFTWEPVTENVLHEPTPDIFSSIPGSGVHFDESIFSAVLTSKQRKALPFLGEPGIYDWPLYRRASHDRQITEIASLICDSIAKEEERCIGILGAPGIGKTVSLVLVLAEVAKKNVDIVCHVQGSETWKHYTPNGTLFIYKSKAIPSELDSPKTLVLYDPADKFDLKSLCIKEAVVCFASSPRDLHVSFLATIFYTYSWSDAEFSAVAPHLSLWGPPEERRRIFGNNPRGLLLFMKEVNKRKDKFKALLSSKPKDMRAICAAFLSPGDSFMGFKLSLPPLGQSFSFTHLDVSAVGPASEWFDAELKKHLETNYLPFIERVGFTLRDWIATAVNKSVESIPVAIALSHAVQK